MISNLIRIFFARQVKAFDFRKRTDFIPGFNNSDFGLYIHIPFCRNLCPFCPYYKIKYDEALLNSYIDALKKEIDLVCSRMKFVNRSITSVYFGGGTPFLAKENLIDINKIIDKYFVVKGSRGIELNPEDVDEKSIELLHRAGFNMVSLGVQSFSVNCNKKLERSGQNIERAMNLLKDNFDVIDTDLIFGIAGQTAEDVRFDFVKAAELGATQISTYPFIEFSYSRKIFKPYGHRIKRRLLDELIKSSESVYFTRESVWTFRKKDTEAYSSVTREQFLGFGASATTLGLDSFKLNVFSVEEYIKAVNNSVIPSSLVMEFTKRSRGLYWIFWSIYNGKIVESSYNNYFGSSLKKDFGLFLKLGKILGLINKEDFGWSLTNRGLYYFHLIEQHYTHQYIDKTWRISMANPWVNSVKLY